MSTTPDSQPKRKTESEVKPCATPTETPSNLSASNAAATKVQPPVAAAEPQLLPDVQTTDGSWTAAESSPVAIPNTVCRHCGQPWGKHQADIPHRCPVGRTTFTFQAEVSEDDFDKFKQMAEAGVLPTFVSEKAPAVSDAARDGVSEFVENYEFRPDAASPDGYDPTDHERALIEDAIRTFEDEENTKLFRLLAEKDAELCLLDNRLVHALENKRVWEKLAHENLRKREWRPISDAPKDGTAVLAKLPDSDIPQTIKFHDGGWCVAWDLHRLSKFDRPSHWMSLDDL